jgi:hypothetical protein
MANAVLLGRRDGSAKEIRLVVKETLAGTVPDDKATDWKEQLRVKLFFKVSPQFVRA